MEVSVGCSSDFGEISVDESARIQKKEAAISLYEAEAAGRNYLGFIDAPDGAESPDAFL